MIDAATHDGIGVSRHRNEERRDRSTPAPFKVEFNRPASTAPHEEN
jgi:hypothetical protein